MRLVPNPYRWHEINLSLFYGRQSLVEEMLDGFRKGHSYAVVGGRRMGKTTLLRKLEAEMQVQLGNRLDAGIIMLPVYVDVLNFAQPLTARSIFSFIAAEVEASLRKLGLLPRSSVFSRAVFDAYPSEENRAFKSALCNFIESTTRGELQIVVLIDEIELIVNSEWGQGFFNNWRALLHNEPQVSPHLDAVFAGAREMASIAKDIGSPLSNVLVWKELTLFSETDTAALVNEPTKNALPSPIAKRVFNQTGGHPFLIQYLMHCLCEGDLETTGSRLNGGVRRFLDEQRTLFQSWWFDKFQTAERRVYKHLAGQNRAILKRDLLSLVGDTAANEALSVLMHTGVVAKLGSQEKYRAAGLMFKKWFMEFGVFPADSVEYDAILEGKLRKVDELLAERYVSAWKILKSELQDYSGAVGTIRGVLEVLLVH